MILRGRHRRERIALAEPKKRNWQKVTAGYQSQGGARRDKASVNVTEHGAAEAGVEATQMIDRGAVARGLDPNKDYMLDFLADEEAQVIAVYAVKDATPGSVTIRRYKRGRNSRISFHMGGVFVQHPTLRPDYREVKCVVTEELDEDGLPLMVIPIKAGKAVTPQSRDRGQSGSQPTPGTQPAAGEDPKA